MLQAGHHLHPPDHPKDDDPQTPPSSSGFPSEGDDLPYKVEVWDDAGRLAEQIVAVSLSPAIGYAAYYAATREFPGRVIVLRHKGRVLSRWSGQTH
jgi:hypothetical protein